MRLIDADELCEQVWREALDTREKIEKLVLRQPTINAEPVRHGHWIFTHKPNIYGGITVKCSECGYEGVIAHIEDHHYCWVCGAKMDVEEEEP